MIDLIFLILNVVIVTFLIRRQPKPRRPAKTLWLMAGWGVAVFTAALLFEHLYIPVLVNGSDSLRNLTIAMAIGFVEEAFKFLPLAFFIYRKPYFTRVYDGFIFFAIVGLTVGFIENLFESSGPGGFTRLIFGPIFHGATTSILGYYLIKAKLHRSTFLTVGLVFVLMGALHGFGDYTDSFTKWWSIVPNLIINFGLTIAFFRYWRKTLREPR